jgi:hypothetical protein
VSTSAEKLVREALNGPRLLHRQPTSVDVDRHADALMAHLLLHEGEARAAADESRPVGVAQGVKPVVRRKASALQDPTHCLERAPVEGLSLVVARLGWQRGGQQVGPRRARGANRLAVERHHLARVARAAHQLDQHLDELRRELHRP